MARYLSRETEPFGKWKGIPIYLTTILCAALVAGLVFTAFMGSAGARLISRLIFTLPMEDWTGWLAVFTYPFIDNISFFTPFAIMVFYWLTVGIETHLGRGALVRLLGILILTPVAIGAFAWWGFSIPTFFPTFCPIGLSGTYLIVSGLLIAFATLYPNAEFWGWVPFKWVAFACIFCGSLMAVARRDWMSVSSLWMSCLTAFLFITHAKEQEYDDHVPLGARVRAWFRRRPKFRVVPRSGSARPSRAEDEPEEVFDSEVDELLEKIAKKGIDSLTAKERSKLERAREELLKKDRK